MKQILQLYDTTATEIDGYSLCSIPDALECEVTEERNGEFILDMTYPASGLNADKLTVGRIIAALPRYLAGGLQGFRISEIKKTIDGQMAVQANHVSYDLSQVIVMPFTASTLADALTGLTTYGKPANAFTFSADFTAAGTFTVTKPTPLRQLLVGQEGSLVDVFGGEWEFDNWHAVLHASRGETKNVQIAYAKNLTGFTETDSLGRYDAVVPYAVYNDTPHYITDTSVVSTAPIVYANGSGSVFGFPKTLALDLSDKFTDAAPTDTALYSYATDYIARNAVGSTVNYSTDFVDLAKVLGQHELVNLCDTIYITVLPFNVYNMVSKIISITYDALTDENTAVEVGDRKITLADTLAETIAAAEKKTGSQIGMTNADTTEY